MSLEEAAAQGCHKCKNEHETGVKTERSHDKGCPRRRGAPRKSLSNRVSFKGPSQVQCSKCKKELELGRKVPGPHCVNCPKKSKSTGVLSSSTSSAVKKSNDQSNEPLEEGDPPWRTKGNAWIGRRLLYKPEAAKEETRSGSKNKFYSEDGMHSELVAASPAIKGTILGFISERDKDINGNPGFVSTRDGLPAMLFHVVFDRGNSSLLLNKDFEEWEINEHCEWIHDESDDDESSEQSDLNDDVSYDDESETEFDEPEEDKSSQNKVHFDSKAKDETSANMKTVAKAITSSSNQMSRRTVTPKQDLLSETSKQIDASAVIMSTNEQAAFANDSNDRTEPHNTNVSSKDANTTSKRAIEQTSKMPNLSHCSSFNEALRSALSTYASRSALKATNNPPAPVPPPFLSHEEESTLRTALAFVMIKARNKKKQAAGSNSLMPYNISTATKQSLSRPSVSSHQMHFSRTGFIARANNMSLPINQESPRLVRPDRYQSLLGGLLMRSQREVAGKNVATSNVALQLEHEMTHIRDVLKLALSSAMSFYRGALETNDEAAKDERRINDNSNNGNGSRIIKSNLGSSKSIRQPSTVYDFEAGFNPPQTRKESNNSLLSRHCASFDGLCEHAATRLARLINDTSLRLRLDLEAKRTNASKQSAPQEMRPDKDSNENNNSDDNHNLADQVPDNLNQHLVRDAIVELIYDDLIGKAYHYELFNGNRSTTRIERIMATCHLIHRVIFFDKSSSFASECIVAISQTLSDLYNDAYFNSSSGSLAEGRNANETYQAAKTKVQVVKPNWSTGRSSYSDFRNERRIRRIDALFRDSKLMTAGSKRKNALSADEDESVLNLYQVPDASDVLTVNLFRLLECATEIRLHHRVKKNSPYKPNPANEIINEIRSTSAVDLTMPIHLDEAATFYLRESHAFNDHTHSLLRPCAKLMLRVHFFGLIKKLSAYE